MTQETGAVAIECPHGYDACPECDWDGVGKQPVAVFRPGYGPAPDLSPRRLHVRTSEPCPGSHRLPWLTPILPALGHFYCPVCFRRCAGVCGPEGVIRLHGYTYRIDTAWVDEAFY